MKVITYDAEKILKDLNEFMISNHMRNSDLVLLTGVDGAIISKFRRDIYYPPEKVVTKFVEVMGKDITNYRIEGTKLNVEVVNINRLKKLPLDVLESIYYELGIYLEEKKIKKNKIQELKLSIKELENEIQLLEDES